MSSGGNKQSQDEDQICKLVKSYCLSGWPVRKNLPVELRQFLSVSSELSVQEGILLRGSRLVIPKHLRTDILNKIHAGHLGITKCRDRANQSVWWPGISHDIHSKVSECPICIRNREQRPEPLIPSKLPDYPWQKVGTDLFDFKGSKYLLVIDYYSRYIEIAKLHYATSMDVINHLKSIFARHGIPN